MSKLSAFGLFAVTAMMLCYAFENRSRWLILAFSISCILGSVYGFLQGAWPFGLVEGVWSVIAFNLDAAQFEFAIGLAARVVQLPIAFFTDCALASAISFSTIALSLNFGLVFSNRLQASIAPAVSFFPCSRINPRFKSVPACLGS